MHFTSHKIRDINLIRSLLINQHINHEGFLAASVATARTVLQSCPWVGSTQGSGWVVGQKHFQKF